MADSSPTKSKVLRSVVLIALFLGVGSTLGYILLAIRVEPPRRDLTALPPIVETVVVRTEDVVEQLVGYGTARAIRQANLAAEVAATVVERLNGIRDGSTVAEGQELIRLDDRQYRHLHERALALAEAEQAALEELEAEAVNLQRLVKTAERELRVTADEKARVADLFEKELAARKEYDFANLAYQQAQRVLQGYEREFAKIAPRRVRLAASIRAYQAEASLAQLDIERCKILAPFTGRIESLSVDVGDRVGPGTVVLKLVDSSRVEIPIYLPASAYPFVHVGAPCRVMSESRVQRDWHGTVARVAPVAEERTRTFAAYVIVDNVELPGVELVPGMFVRAEVRGPVHENAILVPRGACRDGRVLVVEDSIARERRITAGRFIEEHLLIEEGVIDGDRVVLSHLDKLAEGSPVRVRPVRAAASEPQRGSGTSTLESSP